MNDLRHKALRWLIQGFPGGGFREWAQAVLLGKEAPPPRRVVVGGVEIDAADPEVYLQFYGRARRSLRQREVLALEAFDFGRAHLAYTLAEALYQGDEQRVREVIAKLLNALGSLSHYVAELVEEGGESKREEVFV